MKRLRLELLLAAALAAALLVIVALGPAQRGGTLAGLGPPARCPDPPTVPGLAEVGRSGSIEEMAEAVEALRGLEFAELPEASYAPPREFAERLRELPLFPEGQEDLQERILLGLGAIPAGYDLERELRKLAETSVAGYYDPESGDLVVRGAGAADGFSAAERLTLAHELQHALADQTLGFRDLDAFGADQDALAAYRALIEGDAQLITELYASESISLGDQVQLGLALPAALGADIPHYLLRSTTFPYLEGAEFACTLFRRGGWEAVNGAYEDPPSSTAEILFPDRYVRGREAQDPEDPRGLPERWTHEGKLTFGAADLLFLLEAPGGNTELGLSARRRVARAWEGGELHIWSLGDSTVLSLRLLTSKPDLTCEALGEWYLRSFPSGESSPGHAYPARAFHGDGQDASLRCEGQSIRLGIAPRLPAALAASR